MQPGSTPVGLFGAAGLWRVSSATGACLCCVWCSGAHAVRWCCVVLAAPYHDTKQREGRKSNRCAVVHAALLLCCCQPCFSSSLVSCQCTIC